MKHSWFMLQPQGVPVFNDDIESTAAAVVAAVYGAARLQEVPPLAEQHFVFVGAGQANIGSARLLCRALQDEGALLESTKLLAAHRLPGAEVVNDGCCTTALLHHRAMQLTLWSGAPALLHARHSVLS